MGYRDEVRDPYVDSQTGVLTNLANIRDAEKLERFEGEMSIMRQIELSADPIMGCFDLEHLQSIHRHLFQDIYIWAGKLRGIDISKGSTRFGSHLHIEAYLNQLFARLASERETWESSMSGVDMVERLSHYLGEINAAHPFRDGNGRTQRIFIGQLANRYGFLIRWDTMTAREMLEALIASFAGESESLASLLRANLEHGSA